MTIETKWEEELVRAGLHGNHQAIETLFRRYQRQLLGTARRILGNIEDAEDALQDCFFRVLNQCLDFASVL
jgi:DNA-directed RNA polymerase specialized sigma24 family protein